MSGAERAYRLLLRAYPRAFRAEFGREMALVFRDRRREPDANGVGFWAEMIWDVARSAPGLRIEALRARWGDSVKLEEGRMKTMSILAIVIGAYEVANALGDALAGGTIGGGRYLITVIAVLVAALMLAASGVALLRRTPRAAALARVAAITSLAVFAIVGFVDPWMSILARVLGTLFPIALLISLYRTRRGEPSMPMVA